MDHIQLSVPGKTYEICNLKLTCPVCLVTHQMTGTGYKLPQTQEEIEANCARFVLIKIGGSKPICDCLIERLERFPVVSLWNDSANNN